MFVKLNGKSELFPRNVDFLLIGKDLVNVHKEREVLELGKTELCFLLNCASNANSNNERLKSYAVELCLCLVNVKTAAEKDTNETCASAVNGNVKVTCANAKVLESAGTLVIEKL